MSKDPPLVSVVLLNWNGIEDTKICLEHIKEQTYRNYEIIVVDNGSSDSSISELRKIKGINLVENKRNKGFTGGHIDGLRHAKGDFIVVLNNDAVMKPDLIQKALKNFDDEKVAVVGGRAYFWNNESPLLDETNSFYSYQFINTTNAEAIFYQQDYDVPEEVNNVSGSCAIIRRSVIEKLGYFEDAFFAYYEEADLFARYKRGGYKIIYDPAVRIWHKIGASSQKKSSSFMYYMLFRNRFLFAFRNFDSRSLRTFILSYIKFGMKSILKSILHRGDDNINASFVKALVYNIFHFASSFTSRKRLERQLGESDYNARIIIEQSNISHILTIKNTKELEEAVKASKLMRPSHEIVAVVSDKIKINNSLKLPNNFRVVKDKGYFKSHSENIGVIVSRYNWVSFTNLDALVDSKYFSHVDGMLSKLELSKMDLYALTPENIGNSVSLPYDAIDYHISFPLVCKRARVLEIYGFPYNISISTGLSALTAYCASHNVAIIRSSDESTNGSYEKLSPEKKLQLINHIKDRELQLKNSKPHFYESFFEHHYRLQQIRYLFSWLLSPKITLYLKAARIKNLVLFSLQVNRKRIANELKHIRSEILLSKGIVRDTSLMKKMAQNSYENLLKNPQDILVFIICRDRLSPLLELLKWLEAAGIHKIVLVDNDSAYPELIKFLSETDYQVFDMKRNAGHTVVWQQSIIPTLLPHDFYIVTDPDVIPGIKPDPAVLRHLLEVHNGFPDHLKVGFGLKIDDLPDYYSLKKSVIQWEQQFWNSEIAPGVYEAGVDTTFALYKPLAYHYFIHPSLRLGEPYTARHLPWYANDSILSEEDAFYRMHADQNVNTWNKGVLPERYVKELKKLEKRR